MEVDQEDQTQNHQQTPLLSKGNIKMKLILKTHVPDNKMGHDFEPDNQINAEATVFKKQSNTINNINSSHVCSECFKEFSSGKALGGHMRIHAQVFKERDDRKQLNRGGGGGGDVVINKLGKFCVEPVCCVCSKSFGSWKSFFGHMRCHPDREWRGVVPPQEKVSDDYEEDLDDVEEERAVDLRNSLGTWSVKARRGGKGRRGREGGGSSSDFTEEEEEKTLINAASDLLMLNQLVSFDAATSNSVTNNNYEVVVGVGVGGGEIGGVFEEEKVMDKGKGKRKSGEEVEEDLDFVNEKNGGDYVVLEKGEGKAVFVENSDGDDSDGRKAELVVPKKENNNINKKCLDGKVIRKKKKKKKKKKAKKMKTIMDLDSFEEHDVKTENGAERYKCATCTKTFPTHQAFGGHRSSHNKFKMNIFDVIPQQQQQHQDSSAALVPDYQWEFSHQQLFEQQLHQNQANVSEEMLAANNVELSASDHSSVHECRTCNKTFPSGQALGGHMRCHWPGPSLEPAPSAPSAYLAQLAPSSGEEASQDVGSSHPALEFDLNEIPPMEEEEEEGYEVEIAAEEATMYSYGCC